MGNKKPPKISLPNHHQSSIEEETFQPLPKRLKTYQLPRFGQTVWPFGLYRGSSGNECSTTIWSFVTSTWERLYYSCVQLERTLLCGIQYPVSTLLKHVPIHFYILQVVQEYERSVIFRLGRLRKGGAKGPGIFFIIPCIDTYRKVDLRTVSFDVPPQEVSLATKSLAARRLFTT